MAINVTPIPRLTVLATPAFTLGTSNVAGNALTAVASNSTLGLVATKAEMEAATSAAKVATPGRTQNHPGVAKVWVLWNLSNTPMDMQASYNMTSVTDGGSVGNTDHVWATDFSSANYTIHGQAEDDHCCWHSLGTMAAGSITTQNRSANDAVARDSTQSMLVAFGDQ